MKINRNGQAEALTKQEFSKVLSNLANPHRSIFALCWYTLERAGAICRLRVEHVFDQGRPKSTILIPAGIRKDRVTREVPMHKELRGLLQQYPVPGEGYLFPAALLPGDPMPFDTYQKALRRVLERLGMVGYSTHSCRRGAITELARQGVHVRHIQTLSGHKSLASLQRYIEVSPAERERAIALL